MFRDLKISAPKAALARLGESLSAVLPSPPWARDPGREKEMEQAGAGLPTLVFTRTQDARLPSASLSLVLDADTARVGNIVPMEYGQLSMAQYNSILEDFLTTGVQPLAGKLGLRADATLAVVPLTDLLSETAAKKLKLFSVAANKSTGSSHPADYKRWQDFIVQAHQDGCRLDAPLLRRWLQEVERWPEEQAAELASEYDFGRDLLRHLSNSEQ
jgi:hypothetical protein